MSDVPDDPRARFEYFTNEYSQALQAYAAIESQAATLMLMGHPEDLRQFIGQFVEMSARTRDLARSAGETNFAEWFEELRVKAEKLRVGVPG